MINDYNFGINEESEALLTVIEKYTTTPAMISDEVLHKAKRLLCNYKHVLWSIKSNIDEMEEECQLVMNQDLKEVLDILDRYDYRMHWGKLDDKLRANQETRLMEKMIVITMQKVKEYPEMGPIYYEVLSQNYLVKDVSKAAVICNRMAIAKSTYHKYKTEAIKLFGYCLWYIILPNLKKMKQTTVPIHGNDAIRD